MLNVFKLLGGGNNSNQEMLSPIPSADGNPNGNSSGALYQGPVPKGADVDEYRLTGQLVYPGGNPNGGSVLGTSDEVQYEKFGGSGGSGGSSGTNLKDPNANPGSGWFWDAADGWKRSDGGSSTSGPSQGDIDAAYNPIFNSLNQVESSLRSGYEGDVQGVDKRYGTYQKQYEDEGSKLTADATDRQSDFNATIRSALEDAVRAYQALDQQRLARFGSGSSAGGAVGELAKQEFFRQQGKTQQEGVKGEKEFAKEFANIGTFIAQKKADLDMWKEETLSELKKNLNSQLSNIQMQRGQTEANKAQARLSIIQDSINRARAIQDQDSAFRQQLAIAGLNQLQESSGRTFTPAEIKAVVTEFMGGNTDIGASTQATGIDPRTLALYNPNSESTTDELQGLQ